MRTRIGSYRQRFRIAAGILWASPWTAVGCLVGLLALCTGCKVRWRCGVIEFYGGAINWILARLPVGPIAMTLGHTILGRTDAGLDLARSHELVHVRQYERWGLLFVPAYLLSSLAAWIAGKHFYRDNGFEREAFERDGMVRRG
jgi:hypothetical protein